MENRDTLAGLDTLILEFDKELCDPYYITLLKFRYWFNHLKKIFFWFCSRTLIRSHLDEYPMYIPKDKKIINKISNLVKESYEEKQNAFKELESSIKLIEKKLQNII